MLLHLLSEEHTHNVCWHEPNRKSETMTYWVWLDPDSFIPMRQGCYRHQFELIALISSISISLLVFFFLTHFLLTFWPHPVQPISNMPFLPHTQLYFYVVNDSRKNLPFCSADVSCMIMWLIARPLIFPLVLISLIVRWSRQVRILWWHKFFCGLHHPHSSQGLKRLH